MSKNHDIFDDLIKSQLEGFESSVSMDDWTSIESKLDAIDEKKIKPIWWISTVGVLLVIAGFVAWLSHSDDYTNSVTQSKTITSEDSGVNRKSNESVVVKDYLPTEARSGKTANEPNIRENSTTDVTSEKSVNVNTLPSNNSDGITKISKDFKTLPQSTNEDNKLPTKNVDNKLGDISIKGGIEDPSFSTLLLGNTKEQIQFNTIQYPVSDDLTSPINDILPKINRWEVGLSFTPTWANKIIAANGDNAWKINPYFENISKSMEQGSVSYQLKGFVNKHFDGGYYIGAGVTYNQLRESVNYDYRVDSVPTLDFIQRKINMTESDPRIGGIEVQYTGTNIYHFIEVPAYLGKTINFSNDKFHLRLETGLRYMMLTGMQGKKVGVTYMNELIDLSSNLAQYSRHNLGYSASLGAFCKLSNTIDFGFVPYYNRNITSIRNRDEAITEKPYNFGVNFSLQHKFFTK